MGKICIQVCLIMILFLAPITQYSAAKGSPPPSITQLIEQLKTRTETKGTQLGISVYNVSKGKQVCSYHNDQSFVPASVQKLIVSAAALDRLGPTYHYRTEVYALGQIHQGILNGDLLIKGYGDPSFSVNDLQQLTKRLRVEKGLKQIKGGLLVDDTYFDSVRLGKGWTWDDEPWYYSAPIHALSIEGNRMKVRVHPGKKVPRVEVLSPFQGTPVLNHAQMVPGTENQLNWERPRSVNRIELSGTFGRHAGMVNEELSIENSPIVVGELWKQVLQKEHINIPLAKSVEYQKVETKAKPFLVHESKPLSELVRHLNKESDNFYAEMFLKTLGAVENGEGSFQAGLGVVKDYLKELHIKEGYRIVDGSGLSRYNMITPEQLVTLLQQIQRKPYKKVFMDSLPIAGVDGTLENRFLGTSLARSLRAKTGSMSGVSSLAGYVHAKNGDLLAFVIMMNGVYQLKDARVFQDEAVLQLAQFPTTVPLQTTQETSSASHLFSKKIDLLLRQPELKHVRTGLVIKPLDDEKWSYARNAEVLLTPASITKLMLTYTALHDLGPDYRFSTPIFWNARTNALYIKGYGDPSLDGAEIDTILQKVKAKGIHSVKSVVVDENAFDTKRYPWGWSWDEEIDERHGQLSAISFAEGTTALQIQPGLGLGSPGILTLEPAVPHAVIDNQVTTGPVDLVSLTRSKGTNHFQVTGLIGSKQIKHVSVEDPASYLGYVLRDKAGKLGLTSSACGVSKGNISTKAIKVAEIQSMPLKELLSVMLKTDNHFYAEMITKTMGAGSTERGVEKIYKTFETCDMKPIFDLYDGSGVSHYNQIAVEQMAAVVQPVLGDLSSLLPQKEQGVNGISGHATGRASFLGIVKSASGKAFLVVMMQNGYVPDEAVFEGVQKQVIQAIRKASI